MKDSESNGLGPGDHVYYRHTDGLLKVGEVHAVGKDGFIAKSAGEKHRVLHKNYVGHKQRKEHAATVIDQGEDGALARLGDGRAVFLHGYPHALEETEGEDGSKPKVKPAVRKALLFMKASGAKGRKLKNRPGLILRQGVDKRGKKMGHWVRGDAKEAGAGAGFGTHNIEAKDVVHYEHEGEHHTGRVQEAGDKGAKVRNLKGAEHEIGWSQVRGHMTKDIEPMLGKNVVRSQQKPIKAAQFTANDYASKHDDPDVTPDKVFAQFPPEAREMVAQAQRRLVGIEQTMEHIKSDPAFALKRQELHRKIIDGDPDEKTPDGKQKHPGIMSADRIKAAKPAPGQRPVFMALGGRGGSGKNWFKNKMYDPKKFIVINADDVKEQLPEYEGWNAAQVHEESSELTGTLMDFAMAMGLNIVYDATMKSTKSSLDRVKDFKSRGYEIHAHYMHLPRQEAAKRAVGRFISKTMRYVPPSVVLENKDNEKTFDEVRKLADRWSFHDNNVGKGKQPIMISSSDEAKPGKAGKGEKQVAKSYQNVLFLAEP